MKKNILTIILSAIIINSFAVNPDSLVNLANKYYANSDFHKAADTYNEIIKMGYTAPELYYNLGNSYFKLNNYAYAILNYERALQLKPNDSDIKHNLEIANAHIIDRIDGIPQFFIRKWINNLINLQSSNTWAILSMVTFFMSIVLLLFYLLISKIPVKQVSFYFFILMFFVSSCSFVFSLQRKRSFFEKSDAIVVAPSVTAKSSPNEFGTDLFILHEGTKVKIIDNIGAWNEIKISNGSKAWVVASTIEKI